eukprot:6201821-Pleurochrysis_carterae.AAC.1
MRLTEGERVEGSVDKEREGESVETMQTKMIWTIAPLLRVATCDSSKKPSLCRGKNERARTWLSPS